MQLPLSIFFSQSIISLEINSTELSFKASSPYVGDRGCFADIHCTKSKANWRRGYQFSANFMPSKWMFPVFHRKYATALIILQSQVQIRYTPSTVFPLIAKCYSIFVIVLWKGRNKQKELGFVPYLKACLLH